MKSEIKPLESRTWWINLYSSGEIAPTLCQTRDEALNRCTYTGDVPDAEQVKVRLVKVTKEDL